MKRASYEIVFVLLTISQIVSSQYKDEKQPELDHRTLKPQKHFHQNIQFWCNRLRNCKPNNITICGWDPEESFLAKFENICVLYRANCRGAGSYNVVDNVVCETKTKYDEDHPDGDELEWIHIEHGTSAASTASTVASDKKALRQFTEFRTRYSEGGTLPPGFFDDYETQTKKSIKRTKLTKEEWKEKILQLLWRRFFSS